VRVVIGSIVLSFCLAAVFACGSSAGRHIASESTGVAIHAGCPVQQPKVADMRRANRGFGDLKKTLIPEGASRLRLCRYYGTESTAGKVGLAASKLVTDRRVIAGIARTLDSAPVPAPGGQSCPEDTGATAIGFFFIGAAKPVAVQIHLSGCYFATNGFRIVGPRSTVADRVRRLTR
jgi:hypothetical protein